MNNTPLLKTLQHIVEDNESFDADIVELIFKKIQSAYLIFNINLITIVRI